MTPAAQLVDEIEAMPVLEFKIGTFRRFAPADSLLNASLGQQIEFVCETMRRVAELCQRFAPIDGQQLWPCILIDNHNDYPRKSVIISEHFLRSCAAWPDGELARLAGLLADRGAASLHHNRWLPVFIDACADRIQSSGRTEEFDEPLRRLAGVLSFISNADERRMVRQILELLEPPKPLHLSGGEAWADEACRMVENSPASAAQWRDLIKHCHAMKGGTPGKSWSSTALRLIDQIGHSEFVDWVSRWLPLVDKPRTWRVMTDYRWQGQEEWYIADENARVLRGLTWCCGLIQDDALPRVLSQLALCSYRKLPGIGPRLVSLGNACIWALSNSTGREGVHQLALLKVRVKFGTAQKLIENALDAAAVRIGLPREELEEMAVPAYGLTDVGVRREQLGTFTAELSIVGGGATDLSWVRSDGRRAKSVPAAVKKDFAEDLKELKQAAKDIQRMLPAQRERIDQLHLQQKSWAYGVWRERYLDHPLVGTIARRLIWRFSNDGRVADGIWLEGRLVARDGQPIDRLDEDTKIEMWHPIVAGPDEILAWRQWLEAHEIRQPFKQAHRELYLLTDAERQTRVYSNRYAAHIIRQHQFSALCAARGWKNKLRLLVDAEYPPATLMLPKWNLRAEFWIEGIGSDYGVDTNETGTYYRLATDQVRFYPVDAVQREAHAGGGGYYTRGEEGSDNPMPLEEIPPLVFSEVMRDVDLFVGVASVGNDPTWSDGGPEGRYRDYWHGYSFGELAESAKTRRGVLERLVPRLKIAERCSFTERFLVVRGDVRTYKIHLGSGNILMEPNDQYLCIVKAPGRTGEDKLFLPFEGDGTLAVILSKAFLLAEDRKITDPTILSQIRR